MKKGTKFFVFGGLICLLTGGMIMLITGCIGGFSMFRTIATRYTFYIHNNHHDTYWSWNDHDFDDFVVFTGEEEFDLSDQDIRSLYVDVDGVELNIQSREDGKENSVRVEVSGIGIDTQCGAEDGILVVKSKDGWFSSNGEITVYVPRGMEWNSVILSIGAGTADIEDVQAQKMYISVGAGEVSVENVKAEEELSASVGMGQLKFNGNAECDMNISCGMGQIQLEFEGKSYYDDYNYDVNCAAGNVEIGHINIGGIGVRKTIDNNSDKLINVDCGMGQVEIYF